MRYQLCGLAVVAALAGSVCRADFSSDVREAGKQIGPAMKEAEALLAEGKADDADAKLLGTFPEKTRTTAQAYVLANVLFAQDPKVSYALHKRVAGELPGEAQPQFEWAMEQHRAKEYAGAAASYAAFVAKSPDFGPAYGLMAECLIRQGKAKEAVQAWKQSEAAKSGTLETFESMVCEVKTVRSPHRERAALLGQVREGSIDAARKLIALDAAFPVDWWNKDANIEHMKKDLALLRTTKFGDDKGLKEILCAGDCVVAAEEGGSVADVLKNAGFIVGEKPELPQDGLMLSTMLSKAFSSRGMTRTDFTAKWAETIRKRAMAGKDAELFNVAANLYRGKDELEAIDRAAWEATGDERFAASLLLTRMKKGAVKADDAELAKAVKQFPESWAIQGAAVAIAKNEGKGLQEALERAIEAEYAHFSPNALSMRPGAPTLRRYFAELDTTLGSK